MIDELDSSFYSSILLHLFFFFLLLFFYVDVRDHNWSVKQASYLDCVIENWPWQFGWEMGFGFAWRYILWFFFSFRILWRKLWYIKYGFFLLNVDLSLLGFIGIPNFIEGWFVSILNEISVVEWYVFQF